MTGGGESGVRGRGFALLVVILVMLLVSFLASQLIMQVRTSLKIAGNRSERAIGRLLAEGGVSLAFFRLFDRPEDPETQGFEGDFLLGHPYETVLPGGKMGYYAVNESGKINLNEDESTELLELLLAYWELDEDQVAVIRDSLLDWLDADDLYRLDGAEQDYYEEQGLPYVPRNGRLEDPYEFFMVRGTEVLKGRIDPSDFFTTLNTQGKINVNSVTPAMLRFILSGGDSLVADYWEQRRLTRDLTAAQLDQLLGEASPLRRYLMVNSGRNPYYTLTGRGYPGFIAKEEEAGPEGAAKEIHGTGVQLMLRKTGRKFRYLSWRENLL